MERIAIAALGLLTATLMGCGVAPAAPEPPPAAQLLEDVRQAMEAAPSFRFEGETTMAAPDAGTGIMRLVGEASGDDIYTLADPLDGPSAGSGGSAVVDGKFYLRFGGQWTVEPELQEAQGNSPRRMFLPPDEITSAEVHEETRDGTRVWVLTAVRLFTTPEGARFTYSTQPIATFNWVIEPATSRLLSLELTSDFGVVTYPDGSGIESSPMRSTIVMRVFDYDADIVVTLPVLNDPPVPAPTPFPTSTPTP